jgi:phosphohistidine phosphatase
MTARTLVLLRHAKAENPPGVADDKRPLSARGHADAQAAGAWFATRQMPELVLCSPTKRTRQTWHAVATNLPAASDPMVRYERRLYLGGADELLQLVREIEDSVSSALLIGHNPTLSQLAFDLDPAGGLDSDGLRTCGLSVHTVDGPWSECGPRRAPITATHTARGDR